MTFQTFFPCKLSPFLFVGEILCVFNKKNEADLDLSRGLEFEMITPITVQNSIVIGEMFQINVSDGRVHPLEVVNT